jgi:SAM-dependent methyltransferase
VLSFFSLSKTMPSSGNGYYQNNARLFFDQTVDVDMSDLYRIFLATLPPLAKILDAGCGSGRDSKYFLGAGHEVTAFDASSSIAQLASDYIGSPVEVMTFQEMKYSSSFHGIWACASLLHVSTRELPDVFDRLRRALVGDGVLYASFKYGMGEHERNGRMFTNMNELALSDLIDRVGGFSEIKTWITGDQRAGREDELWLNTLLRAEEIN